MKREDIHFVDTESNETTFFKIYFEFEMFDIKEH